MKAGLLKQIVKDIPDNEEIFVFMFEKSEAEEHIVENFNEGKDFPISKEQWSQIVQSMDCDEGIWEEITNCWVNHIEKLYTQTKEGKINESVK